MPACICLPRLCIGFRIVNVLPSTMSLAESCPSCSPTLPLTTTYVWSIHWKGLRGDDRNDLLQRLDCGSITTFYPTLVFLRESFDEPDHAGGIDLRTLKQQQSRQIGRSLLLQARFSVNNSFTILSRSTHLLGRRECNRLAQCGPMTLDKQS